MVETPGENGSDERGEEKVNGDEQACYIDFTRLYSAHAEQMGAGGVGRRNGCARDGRRAVASGRRLGAGRAEPVRHRALLAQAVRRSGLCLWRELWRIRRVAEPHL